VTVISRAKRQAIFDAVDAAGLARDDLFDLMAERRDLRDVFAGRALVGLLSMEANPNLGSKEDIDAGNASHLSYFAHGHDDLMAKAAYGLADAMLRARRQSDE
jgi:hypothetical protein